MIPIIPIESSIHGIADCHASTLMTLKEIKLNWKIERDSLNSIKFHSIAMWYILYSIPNDSFLCFPITWKIIREHH